MASINEDFPRSIDPTDVSRVDVPKKDKDDLLFQTRNKRSVSKLGKLKRVPKGKKSTTSEKNNLNKIVIENLTLPKLIENTVIYGCVQEIGDFELKFSITGGISVIVPLTNISRSYTEIVQSFANDSSTVDNVEIAKLTSMFNIGDYYPIKILSKRVCDHFGHTDVVGSINPADIHKNLSSKSFSKLDQGFNLVGAVVSKEDYGYQMDIGVTDVKAFLSFEDLKKNSHTLNLSIGQLVHCSILEANERSIVLTTSRKLSNFCFNFEQEPSVHYFIPGTQTTVCITGVHNTGLELSLPGGFKGFVPRYHISDDIIASPKKFTIGDIVRGHVLYVHPHTKQVCVSLKTKLEKKAINKLTTTIRLGLIIDNAVVCAKGDFGAVFLKLPSNSYAICKRKNLSDQKDEDSKFTVGSSHRCRIKKFHLFDNLIEVSLKKSFIESKDLSADDLHIGDIVEGTIKKFKKPGVYVRLGFALNGFIPNIHLTDAPLQNQTLNREKTFPLKSQIRCRITRLDLTSRTPKISLTAKKTLLKMDQSDLFTDFAEIKPGMSATGVICLINSKGILLEFFNYVRGFIPIKYLATYKIEHPDKVFSIGQTVKCNVIFVDPVSERLVCSLIRLENPKKLKTVNKNTLNSTLEVGQILKKMKIISKIPKKGFDLTNAKGNIEVFLPLSHMSDDYFISRLLFTSFKVGDIIDELFVFAKDEADVVSVSRKKVFISSLASIVKSVDEIQLNRPFPAVVRNVTQTGIFFETPNSLCGVIRNKYLQDSFVNQPHKLDLFRGQTIFVTAFELASFNDKDEQSNHLKRFKFSMRLSDVWNNNTAGRLEMAKTNLSDYNLALKLLKAKYDEMKEIETNSIHSEMKQLLKYSIGQVVTYVVTNIADKFVELKVNCSGSKTEPTVPAIALKYTTFPDLSVSHMGNAVICDIDFEQRCLNVFIQPTPAKIVRQIKNASQKATLITNVKVDQVIKGTIIYVCNRYALASLVGHAPGVVAYIPAKRHYNDFGKIDKLFTVGQDQQLVILHHFDGQFVLAVNQPKKMNKMIETLRKRTRSDVSSPTESNTTVNEPKPKKLKSDDSAPKSEPEVKIDHKSEVNVDKPNQFEWNIPELVSTEKRIVEETEKSDYDSDSSEESGVPSKKRKTRQERNDLARQQECQLRAKENALSNTERTPQDEQDFEMAIVASPNSSLVWLKYMAFFLEKNNDINKAREIGERALERISFREEKEKFNIWIGLLNLENTYGDDASMKALLERAIKFNDPKAVHLQLANIYNESNKKEKAEEIYHLVIKKFNQDPSVWNEFMQFYMKNDRHESARKLFKKSLLSLDSRDHVEMISKFAQLEFVYGDCEQAKTIFETMLATHWRRLDKWSVYLDMLIKYTAKEDDIDSLEFIRNIFERLLTFKFTPHKLKFVFRKYFDFESKYSADNVEVLNRLQAKANEYVDNGVVS